MSLWASARQHLWNWKRVLRRATRRLLPGVATYSEMTALDGVDGAWPARKTIFPTPWVYVPDEHDRRLWNQNPYYSSRDVALPAIAVNAIEGGSIFVGSGLVADSRGRLIVESAKDFLMFLQYPEVGALRHFGVRRLDECRPCATIMNGTSQARNWYHWVVDALPRLHALGQLDEEVVLLIPPTLGGTRLQILEWAKPENVELRVVDSRKPVQCETVLFSPFATVNGCGLMRGEVVAFLRAGILSRATSSDGRSFAKRIYTTRKLDPVRQVANEAELIAALEPLGFEVVDPGSLSLAEQVRCFAGAEMVVGPHGANLTGLLFSSNAVAVELAPLNLCYWGVSRSAGNHYSWIDHPGVQAEELRNLGGTSSLRNVVQASRGFSVDVARVVQAINESRA